MSDGAREHNDGGDVTLDQVRSYLDGSLNQPQAKEVSRQIAEQRPAVMKHLRFLGAVQTAAVELWGAECPDDETLAEFVQGSLEEPEAERVREHLRMCEACADAVMVVREFVVEPQAHGQTSVAASRTPDIGTIPETLGGLAPLLGQRLQTVFRGVGDAVRGLLAQGAPGNYAPGRLAAAFGAGVLGGEQATGAVTSPFPFTALRCQPTGISWSGSEETQFECVIKVLAGEERVIRTTSAECPWPTDLRLGPGEQASWRVRALSESQTDGPRGFFCGGTFWIAEPPSGVTGDSFTDAEFALLLEHRFFDWAWRLASRHAAAIKDQTHPDVVGPYHVAVALAARQAAAGSGHALKQVDAILVELAEQFPV
jgi:anti-sigma factor RsiW